MDECPLIYIFQLGPPSCVKVIYLYFKCHVFSEAFAFGEHPKQIGFDSPGAAMLSCGDWFTHP